MAVAAAAAVATLTTAIADPSNDDDVGDIVFPCVGIEVGDARWSDVSKSSS